MVEIVSRETWEAMLRKSQQLFAEAESVRRAGRDDLAVALWAELRPLNRKIRNPTLLRVRGIDA